MISKLAKAKENWFFKIISAAVAVSFISLFGVTGYISNASQNQSVVKIGNRKVTQSEFSYRLQKEINALKNLTGDDFELTDEMRNALTESVLKQIINENVLDLTMEKYDIAFPKVFIQQAVFSRPEFQNPANGQFNPEIFKRYLSSAGISESEYVDAIRRAMAQNLLVSDLLGGFAVPDILSFAVHKMDNQRKIFKYTVVSPTDIKIERKISDDEVKQYFADFSERFSIPEMREAKVLFIPNETIIKKYAATDEMAKDYYKQHKKEFDIPQKREVLQMVFMDKETAEKAYEAVNSGADFNKTAESFKAENSADPSLGVVSEDELAEDLATAAFEMKTGENKLLQVADTWQVIQIKQIIEAHETTFAEVKSQIVEELANENLYDAIREIKAEIDDSVNSGENLENIAQKYGIDLIDITGITEEKPAENLPERAKKFAATLDFNELVFSYGKGEISSTEEFDEGVAIVQVIDIIDEHLPEPEEIKDEIVALWTVQEKIALAKETADNIVADIEDGSEISTAAKARGIEAYRSEPVSRNETFAGLNKAEISELFTTSEGAVKVFEKAGNSFVIAVPYETVNYEDELTPESLKEVQDRIKAYIFYDMREAALDNYAKDFKIKIDYKLAGFAE